MITREDPRYVTDHDDPKAVLVAWFGALPMGAWADDDMPAFRAAVEDEMRHIWDNTERPCDMSRISIEIMEGEA